MKTENILKKIAQLQTVGNNVIQKMAPATNYLRSIDSLEWLKWKKIEIQEVTDINIVVKNMSIDYSKVTNPSYGRETLPLRILEFSDRDFAKYVRLLAKVSRSRSKVVDSYYAEEKIKRLQIEMDYYNSVLNQKEKNQESILEFSTFITEEYPDFIHPDFTRML